MDDSCTLEDTFAGWDQYDAGHSCTTSDNGIYCTTADDLDRELYRRGGHVTTAMLRSDRWNRKR